MRKILMAAAVLLVMAGRAEAQGVATQNVNLTANVGGYCTVDGTATGTVRSAVVPTSNGKVAGGSLTLSGASGKVICTTNAKIQLKTASGGLTNGPNPSDANFTNKVHYTATASYNGKTEQLITTDATTPGFTTVGTDTVGGPQTNQDLVLAVTVAPTPAGKFLVSGAYSDTLTVTLTPVP
jgi:hypothetical protein